jgi:predicted aspartyl protease
MINVYTFTVLLCLSYLSPVSSQIVKTKDGVILGQRSEFISSCIKGAEKKMKINGLEIETSKYCACVCDKIFPEIYSWELEKAMKENKMNDLLLNDKNIKIVMDCLDKNFKENEIFDIQKFDIEKSDNPEMQKKLGIKYCVEAIVKDKELIEIVDKENAEKYCNCVIKTFYSTNYTYKEFIKQISDKNSLIFNEVAVPCLSEIIKAKTETKALNSNNINNIIGGDFRSQIPLIEYFSQGYKVKIDISGVSKYYLIDTAKSDLVIDRDTERELLLNGILKKENYIDKVEISTGSSQEVKVQRVKLNNIKIGDYIISSVIISITDEGNLFLGKELLAKFKKWEIDTKNKFLILYK